ncbi:MAG: glycosyltransferase [Bacteroidales bacterium]|nr:glycosyltransferase [Bacteroidales bacterium]
MDLSIVIVNYNVEHFLEHCLKSVEKALKGIDAEIFVVDNNSVDGSVLMLKEKFPDVKLIENTENVGFAKANNQAIRLSQGRYVLLLNPDTVVNEDSFSKCIAFMDSHPDAGGLGVKMIDGQGKILKESKRGFPTPWVCFCKMSGLASLFPNSQKYCGYYMGHLSYEQTNKVDILAGAYMFLRKECLDKCGLLDETFFMYGEDIDLSYRITLAGYNNYYFADTQIIHYKGESTKKGSLNYVYTFYNAMDIFARKHMKTRSLSLLLKCAIWFKASFSFLKRILNNVFLPLTDFVLLYLSFYLSERIWASAYWNNPDYYPSHYSLVALPLYALIIMFSVYIFGGYEKKSRTYKLLYGVFTGMIALLVFYSLMPAEMRYSRAMVIICSIVSFFVLGAVRYLRGLLLSKRTDFDNDTISRYVIIGDKEETERVANLLKKTNLHPEFIGMISTDKRCDRTYFLGNVSQISDIIRIYKIGEIIFCAKSIAQNEIINIMNGLSKANVKFTIAPEVSNFIIGSNSINTPTDAYVVTVNAISSESNRRVKRLIDLCFSFFLLILSPVMIFIYKKPLRGIKNVCLILLSLKTFVGYNYADTKVGELPKQKKSVISVSDNIKNINPDVETIHRLNLLYARNYDVKTDIDTILKNFRNI